MRGRPRGDLVVEGLRVSVHRGDERSDLVRGASFVLAQNETVGLIGPSGSGKTTVALAILGLPPGGRKAIVGGSIRLGGRELTSLTDGEYRSMRGPAIGMVFQDPSAALTPVHRVGRLLADSLLAHRQMTGDQITERTHALLGEVGFPDPGITAGAYLHQLSGGMRQRVAIALALASEPSVLIADEPTSSLDVIGKDEILGLIEEIRSRREISVLVISHEPEVIGRLAGRTIEMSEGRISTNGAGVAGNDRNRTAVGVRAARDPATGRTAEFSLELRRVCAVYPEPESRKQAITNVSLAIRPGETLGLVGESGAGKTTIARVVLRLIDPLSGQVLLGGVDLAELSQRKLRPLRPQVSAVFQHPASSLNPRHRITQIVAAPLRAQGIRDRRERTRLAHEALAAVDLPATLAGRLPHELSGGQQQRVALARALVSRPRVLICDEPFTALDHPLREQLTELLTRLQADLGVACLFIAHDLEVIARISDQVAVMQDGKIIESGTTQEILTRPAENFTQRLVSLSPGLRKPEPTTKPGSHRDTPS